MLGYLGLSPFPDEVIFIDTCISSIPVYTVIHPLTFLESLLIFSNKIVACLILNIIDLIITIGSY